MSDPTATFPADDFMAPAQQTSGTTVLVAWISVVILCIAQIVSTIDRGMLALVIDLVRHDLQISELQIALLQGFAFSVFYVTVGLPLGVIADVVNRRRLLVAGIIVWSAATIGGGLAQNFEQMFVSRLFIGVGEAVLGPCAVTMISDMFPVTGRGRPMSVYVFGSMIALGIGSLVSGFILQAAPAGVFEAIPFISTLAPWRIIFVLIGGFGFIVAVLLMFLREPKRRDGQKVAVSFAKLNFGASFRYFADHGRIYLPLYGALALFAVGGSVAMTWGAVQLTRVFGFNISEAGKALGVSQIGWAIAGALLASVLVDAVARRYGTVGKVRLAGALALAAIPSCIAVLAYNGTTAVVMIGEIMFISAIYGTTMLSVIAEVTPARVRGLAVALYAFVMTMIGMSIGPIAVASLTENAFQSPAMVGSSMAIVGTGALVLSALLSWRTAYLLAGRTNPSGVIDGPVAAPGLIPVQG